MTMPVSGSKVTSAVWASLDDTIVSGHENGDVCKWDIKVSCAAMKFLKDGIEALQFDFFISEIA